MCIENSLGVIDFIIKKWNYYYNIYPCLRNKIFVYYAQMKLRQRVLPDEFPNIREEDSGNLSLLADSSAYPDRLLKLFDQMYENDTPHNKYYLDFIPKYFQKLRNSPYLDCICI